MSVRPTPRRLLAVLAIPLAIAACGGSGTSPDASVVASPAESPVIPASPSAVASPSVPASAPPSAGASVAPSPSGTASGSPGASADLTVTAVDFAFQGVPADVPSGTTLAFANAGQEVHEMIVVRRLPGTTQSLEELLAMPPEEAQALIEDVGFAIAEPGETAEQVVTLDEPGAYVMLCFIPAGTTALPSIDPDSSAPPELGTGAPHAALGMVEEFTVTE